VISGFIDFFDPIRIRRYDIEHSYNEITISLSLSVIYPTSPITFIFKSIFFSQKQWRLHQKNNSFDNIRGSEQISQLLSEYDELESESDIDDTDADANCVHHLNKKLTLMMNSYEQNESFEDEIQPTGNRTNYFYGRGRGKFKRSKIAPSRNVVRTAAHNIIGRMHLPGVKGPARLLGRECIFTDDMLTEIVIRTNEKLANARSKYSKDRTELN